MNKSSIAVLCVVCSLLSFFAGAMTLEYSQAAHTKKQVYDVRSPFIRDNILILLNEERLKNGEAQLAYVHTYGGQEVEKVAQDYARKLDENESCDHSLFERYIPYAELLTCNVSDSRQAVQMLMDSPTHRDALLKKRYRAVTFGISGERLVVHLFP